MKSVEELLQQNIWMESDKLKTRMMKVNKLFRICVVYTTIGASFANLTPFTTHKLNVKMYLPDGDIMFYCAAFYQLLEDVLIIIINTTLDFLPIHFICFAIGFYEELNATLKSMKETEKLIEIIEIEIRIRSFVDETLKSFGTVTFIQAFLSSIMLCTNTLAISLVSLIELTICNIM